ncbi:MAG: glycosyltransferase family 2 protein [Firmicutes bacterium]|nr:glycosyltransferase family 2 protein [Bacillota bacterium]
MLSVVLPVYNEEAQIARSVQAIRSVLEENRIGYELILVDDGSSDGTWSVLKELALRTKGVRALRFTRNFGKEAAILAGLEAAGGGACLVMDADLQHPPELIPEMFRLWKEEGYEIVEGVKSSRGKEGLIGKIGAGLFYWLLRIFSGLDLKNASDFKLLDAKVVSALLSMGERVAFFRGMAAWVGFRRTSILFAVVERAGGTSKWSWFQLVKLAINAITSFSSLPLQIVTYLGVIFLAGSVVLAAQTLYMKFRGEAASGFTTIILLLLLIGSCLMISLGIIGMYIARIFQEVKARPRYLLSEVVGIEEAGPRPPRALR